jgi:hypothetical protein
VHEVDAGAEDGRLLLGVLACRTERGREDERQET